MSKLQCFGGISKRTVGSSDSGPEGFTIGILGTKVLTEIGTVGKRNRLRVESTNGTEDGLGIRTSSAWDYARLTLDIDVDFGQDQ